MMRDFYIGLIIAILCVGLIISAATNAITNHNMQLATYVLASVGLVIGLSMIVMEKKSSVTKKV